MESVKTLCPYCGVGCGLEVTPPAQRGKAVHRDSEGTPIWRVRGDRQHPSSQGMVCVKGATVAECLHKDRLRYPMIRSSLSHPWQQVRWEEAITHIAERIQAVQAEYGSDGICMYGSGQFQTEDYYVAQKLIKGCLGTNNFDANSRLCMASAVAGYMQSFGSDGPPCCYDDLEQTNCAFLIGTNTAECHPIIFNRLQKYHRKHPGVKLIVVDPRRTPTAEAADLHLAIRPGTDIDLLNGIANLLVKWEYYVAEFIEECTTGFAELMDVIQHYPPERVAERCGISVADLETAARYWGQSKRVLSLWSMGLNQYAEGTAKVRCLINLHLLTGQIGRPGTGPFSLTGQPNAMGGREAGGLAHILPGYRLVKDPDHRAEVEQAWHLPPNRISAEPGRMAWDIIRGLEQGEVGCLWVACTNPVVSFPDLERTKRALYRSPFTIFQDAYHPTEMSEFAHVLLPAAQWSEKTGTMTNSERVVTYCPAFRSPPGQAKPDWQIFAEVGRALGFTDHFPFSDPAEVYAEFVQLTQGRPCDVTGLSHERLQREGPIQWPCRASGELYPGEPKHLYGTYRFHTPDGRARFGSFHAKGLAEPPDPDFPFVMTNGRLYGHWHTQSRTGRIPKIRQMHPEPFLEMHYRDAEQQGIAPDSKVEVRSRRGRVILPVQLTYNIVRGTVFAPMHWGSLWADLAEVNGLTHATVCPLSKQPELKACAVQVLPFNPNSELKLEPQIVLTSERSPLASQKR